jgi:hypothetical protein
MLRTIIVVVSIILLPLAAIADETVRGHWKDTNHDGVKDTYVNPYHRTSPNSSAYDNYSSKPNINPYTGEKGSVDPNSTLYGTSKRQRLY